MWPTRIRLPPPVDKLKNKVDRFNPPRNILNEGWGNCWVLFDQRFTGAFTNPLDLEDFPYDKQTVSINIESQAYTSDKLTFFYDRGLPSKAVPSDMKILEWDIYPSPDKAVKIVQDDHYYPLFDLNYSRFRLSLRVQRQPGYYINKVVVGVMLLGTMNCLIYSLAVSEADRQMGTISIFLAMVAYLFVTSSDLPKVAVATRIDKFMTLNFVAVFFTMIVHAALYLLREKEDSITAAKLEELKQRKTRGADFQSKSSITSTADINLVPIGSSKSDDSAEDADKDGPKHEHDDEGHEVEEPLLERFLSWRHFVFTRKMDLIVVCSGYAIYLILALTIMFGPSPPDVPK